MVNTTAEEFIKNLFQLTPAQHVTIRSPHAFNGVLPLKGIQLPNLTSGDWYFGVCPVDRNGAQVGVPVIWIDIDGSLQPPIELAMAPPSALVTSGNGLHLYYLSDTLLDFEQGMRIVKMAAHAFQGDIRVCEPRRVMRIPGSFNSKDPSNLKPCQLLSANWKSYSPTDLESRLVAAIVSKHWIKGSRHSLSLALGALLARAKWDLDRILNTIDYVCNHTQDSEQRDREIAAQDSALKYQQGLLTSYTALKDAMDKQFKTFVGLLGITSRDGELLIDDEVIGKELTLEQSMVWYVMDKFKDYRYGDGVLFRWKEKQWVQLESDERQLAHGIFHVLAKVKKVSGGEEYELGATNRLARNIAQQFMGYLMSSPMPAQLPGYIPLDNTVMKLPEFGTMAHDPTMYNRIVFPVDYDESATCPSWLEFLSQAIPDPAVQQYLKEWVGYCLLLGNPYHKMVWLYGPTGTGKSTFLLTLNMLFGNAAKTLYIDQITAQTVANISNAYLAICAELSGRTLDVTLVNQLVSEDVMTARHLYGREFKARFRGKLMVSSNYLPPVEHGEIGFWRRLGVIPFNEKPKRVNPYLLEEFAKELSGIFNWALEGLIALMTYEKTKTPWITPAAVLKITADYHTYADIFDEFFRTNIIYKKSGRIKRQLLYNAYRTWCKDNGHLPIAYNSNFINEVKKRGLEYDTMAFTWTGGELTTISLGMPGAVQP